MGRFSGINHSYFLLFLPQNGCDFEKARQTLAFALMSAAKELHQFKSHNKLSAMRFNGMNGNGGFVFVDNFFDN